jgi:nuclease-like protein
VLHDRRIPRSRANIDHLVVTPVGVYVSDAKRYTGKVEKRDKGGLFRTDLRLYVGTRDCSRLLGMDHQLEAVRAAVGNGPPIHPVLCLIEAEWGLFTKPFTINGVLVCWPKALYKLLRSAGPGSIEQVAEIATRVASGLPPA